MFVFANVVVCHVYVVVCVAWYNRVHHVECSGCDVIVDEQCVPFAIVDCVWAAWVMIVEVMFVWDCDEGGGAYA